MESPLGEEPERRIEDRLARAGISRSTAWARRFELERRRHSPDRSRGRDLLRNCTVSQCIIYSEPISFVIREQEHAVYARAVEQADARLRELRQEERGDLALAATAVTASLVATEVRPALAAPIFIGGLVAGVLGARALWRRWDLLERLSGERDAHVISEVRAFAAREATMERRQSVAALVRSSLRRATRANDARLLAAADELEALARELEDSSRRPPLPARAC